MLHMKLSVGFEFNISPPAKVICRWHNGLKSHPKAEKFGIEPVTQATGVSEAQMGDKTKSNIACSYLFVSTT